MSPNPIKISELSGVLLMVKPPFVLLWLHYTGGNFVSVTFVDTHFIHRKSEALKSFALSEIITLPSILTIHIQEECNHPQYYPHTFQLHF